MRKRQMLTIIEKINKLRKEKNAVILAHNYQIGDVQDIADFVGDSLALSRKAASTEAEVIIFCGVHFMAETAKILSPEKTVILPDENAGCPMANMLTKKELLAFKAEHPEALVVAYVNCSAKIKAEADVCCTSANAVKVIESLPEEKEILFVPDQSLGDYVRGKTGRKITLWPGYCPTHHRFLKKDVEEAKRNYPNAPICVHPESTGDVLSLADFIGSTSQILAYCRESDKKEFVIGTEIGILHTLKKENPEKIFYPLSVLGDCPNMKLTTLEKILWSLEDMEYEIKLNEKTRLAAENSVKKMVKIG